MDLDRVAQTSNDIHTQTAAVIVTTKGIHIEAANRMPLGIEVTPERQQRPEKYLWIEHAERQVIHQAARHGLATLGATMHLNWFPCVDCARAIVEAGIYELKCKPAREDDPKWGEHFPIAKAILTEGGVIITEGDSE